ncbi:MAG: amino acid permease [Gemmatimonadaceae bacterium]|nr:amino acid permease [Gemmatimonadaceae bacterium]
MTLPADTPSHKLGPWTATALVVGNIIGVGVFVLPTSLAPYGWGSVVGWTITLIGALSLAWVLSVLSRRLPDSGGAMGIVRLAFGGDVGFLNAWGYWISVWVANAVIAIAGVNYLGSLIPGLTVSKPATSAASIAALWMLTWVNWRGPRSAGSLQLITTILKAWPFIATIFVGILLMNGAHPPALLPFSASQFTLGTATATATLTLYAMTGLESAAVPASTVENPEKVIPRATMFGTLFSGLANTALSLTIIALLPSAQLASSKAPLVDFLAPSLGVLAGALVSLSVAISAFGCLNGWVLLSAEIPAGLAESGELPLWWGRRNRHGAASHALVVSSVLTSVVIALNASDRFTNVFTFALLLSTATILILYLLIPLAALRFAMQSRIPPTGGLLITAVLATLFAIWAIVGAGGAAVGWGAVLTAAG